MLSPGTLSSCVTNDAAPCKRVKRPLFAQFFGFSPAFSLFLPSYVREADVFPSANAGLLWPPPDEFVLPGITFILLCAL